MDNQSLLLEIESLQILAQPQKQIQDQSQNISTVEQSQEQVIQQDQLQDALEDLKINDLECLVVQSQCLICFEKMPLDQLFTLSNCTHNFHKNCLTELVKSKSEFPVCCPQTGCLKEILQVDLGEIADKETLQKLDQYTFNQFLFQNAATLFHCPTQGCTMIVEQLCDQFTCPLCNKQYCKKCKEPFHQGQCGDDQFMQLANEKKFQQCSKCKLWIEKNQGCEHITCRCTHQFCYICGGVWGNCNCKK